MRHLFTLCLLWYFVTAQAQPGSLDESFGTYGTTLTSYKNEDLSVAGSALQDDDKIVVGGTYYSNGKAGYFAVRYRAKGSLDSSFGTNGKTVVELNDGFIKARAVAVQPDGKILITGYVSNTNGSNFNMLTLRLTSKGYIDSSFGKSGKTVTDFGGDEFSNAICLQPDGKIIIGGSCNNAVCLVRYKSNGKIDASFGTNGRVISLISFISGIRSIEVQADKKIVAGGTDDDIKGFLIARYKGNGTVDSSFGSNGFVRTKCSANGDLVEKLVIQNDKKIIAVGRTGLNNQSDTNKDMVAVRYNINGSLDNLYGKAGIATVSLKNSILEAYDGVLQNDGKLLIAGYKWVVNEKANFCLVRLTTNGQRDATFGTNGIAITNIKQTDIAYGVDIQKSGDIPTNGYTINISLAAYNSDISKLSKPDLILANKLMIPSISIYPNSAKSDLIIHDLPAGKTNLIVIDLAGNILMNAIASGDNFHINISSLKQGNYMLRIEADSVYETKAFIKE